MEPAARREFLKYLSTDGERGHVPPALTDFRLCEKFHLTREQLYAEDGEWLFEVLALLQLEEKHRPKRGPGGRGGADDDA